MKIQRLFILISFFLFPFLGFTQKDSLIYIIPEVGLSYSQGTEISRVYDFGGKITSGISIPIMDNRIRLNPNVSLNYFGNNFNEGTRDNLFFWNFGLAVERNYDFSKSIDFAPYIGVFYLMGNNYLSPRSGYQGDVVDLFEHQGVGFDFGFKILFEKQFFLKANFQIVTTQGEIDEGLKREIERGLNVDDALYDVIKFSPTEFSFNNLTLSVGYNYKIR